MEDVAKALEIAGAMFIFVIAIVVAFLVFGQAKTTSDTVFLATDKTTYQETVLTGAPNLNVTREVGIETIIPMMYRYNTESLRIVIINKNGDIVLVLDSGAMVEGIIKNIDRDDLPIIVAGTSPIIDISEQSTLRDKTKEALKTLKLKEVDIINKINHTAYTQDQIFRNYLKTYTSINIKKPLWWDMSNDLSIKNRVDRIIKGKNEAMQVNGINYDINCGTINFKNYLNSKFNEYYITYETEGQEYIPGMTNQNEIDNRVDEKIELVAVQRKKVIIYKEK